MTERTVGWDSPEGQNLAGRLVTLGFTANEVVELQAKLPRLTLRRHEAGELVAKEGEVGELTFIGYTGRMTVSRDVDGKQVKVTEVGPGSLQGEMAVLSGLPRFASVLADEPCEMFCFTKPEFRIMLEIGNRFRDRVDESMGGRMGELPG